MGRGQQGTVTQGASPVSRQQAQGASKGPRRRRSRKALVEIVNRAGVCNSHGFYTGDEPRGQVFVFYAPGDTWHPQNWSVARKGYSLGSDNLNRAKEFLLFSTGGSSHSERKALALEQARAWAGERYGISEWGQDPFGGWGDAGYVTQRTAELEAEAEAKASVAPPDA